MPVVNGYCTEAELREHLGDGSSKLTTALLQRAINATSRAIDDYCGWPLRKFWLDASATTRRFKADDPYVLDVMDIGNTATLIVRTDTTDDGTFDTTWDAADFQLEPIDIDVVAVGDTVTPYAWTRIVAVGDKTFPTAGRRPRAQVMTRFGWSGIPVNVNEASLLKSSRLFRRKDATLGFVGVDDFGPVRITARDTDVIDLLQDYVRGDVRGI